MEPHHAGDVVADTYRIEGVLGQGGIGTTYSALDVRSGQRVALKQVWLWQRHDWKVYELFEREARVLAGISHPAVPRYLGHFQLETERGPCFYLAQELAPGYPLSAWVQRGWRPDEAEIRRIANELLQILEHLHALAPPVIHRDIKPENVLRSEDGRLYLVDFGSVRDAYQNTIAHEHLDRALELDPKSVRALVRRAYAHSYQDDLDKADEAGRKAYDLAPTHPRVLLVQARLAARRKNDDEAFKKLRTAFDQTEDHYLRSAVYGDLVDLYRRRGEWDAADETFRSLVNLEPDSPWTRGEYAEYLVSRERWDEAIEMAKQALAIMDHGMARSTLASAYAGKALAQKDPKEAEKLVDEAFKANRFSADAHYARGVLAMRDNSNLKARLAFKQALAIDPKHDEAKTALEDLDK